MFNENDKKEKSPKKNDNLIDLSNSKNFDEKIKNEKIPTIKVLLNCFLLYLFHIS